MGFEECGQLVAQTGFRQPYAGESGERAFKSVNSRAAVGWQARDAPGLRLPLVEDRVRCGDQPLFAREVSEPEGAAAPLAYDVNVPRA